MKIIETTLIDSLCPLERTVGRVDLNAALAALTTLNASIPATARTEGGYIVMRFTKVEWDEFCGASFNAIRVIKESRKLQNNAC